MTMTTRITRQVFLARLECVPSNLLTQVGVMVDQSRNGCQLHDLHTIKTWVYNVDCCSGAVLSIRRIAVLLGEVSVVEMVSTAASVSLV